MQAQVFLRVPEQQALAGAWRQAVRVGDPLLVRELPLHLREGVPGVQLDLPAGGDWGQPGILPGGVHPRIRGHHADAAHDKKIEGLKKY